MQDAPTCENQTWRPVFRRRGSILLILIGLWLLVLTVQLLRFMVIERDSWLKQTENKSWRIGVLPALRGRILSRNGIPLAWSVRRFSLVYQIPSDPGILQQDWQKLQQKLHSPLPALLRVQANAGKKLTLIKTLRPSEMIQIEPLVAAIPRLKIAHSFRREHIQTNRSFLRLLGKTRVINDVEVGISGWERQFDPRLKGKDGRYRVMVDKYGHWIRETWQELQSPTPGYDVYVGVTVSHSGQ